MKRLWLFLAVAGLTYAFGQPQTNKEPLVGVAPNVDSLSLYIGTTEIRSNRGPMIDKMNRLVGNPLGSAYCAAAQSWALTVTKAQYPKIRTGLATKFITSRSIPAALAKTLRIPNGYLVIWRKGATIFGHAGAVVGWDNGIIYTIEANTSPSNRGSQREGDGIWYKTRRIDPYDYFRIVFFTPVEWSVAQ
jgi:hypothetical protein